MASPLDSYVSKSAPGTLKLPPLPNLGELISNSDFKRGHQIYHEKMMEWVKLLEQLLNERLQAKDVPPGPLT